MPTLFVNDDSLFKLYREASGRVRAVSLKLYDSLMEAGKAAAYGEAVSYTHLQRIHGLEQCVHEIYEKRL